MLATATTALRRGGRGRGNKGGTGREGEKREAGSHLPLAAVPERVRDQHAMFPCSLKTMRESWCEWRVCAVVLAENGERAGLVVGRESGVGGGGRGRSGVCREVGRGGASRREEEKGGSSGRKERREQGSRRGDATKGRNVRTSDGAMFVKTGTLAATHAGAGRPVRGLLSAP